MNSFQLGLELGGAQRTRGHVKRAPYHRCCTRRPRNRGFTGCRLSSGSHCNMLPIKGEVEQHVGAHLSGYTRSGGSAGGCKHKGGIRYGGDRGTESPVPPPWSGSGEREGGGGLGKGYGCPLLNPPIMQAHMTPRAPTPDSRTHSQQRHDGASPYLHALWYSKRRVRVHQAQL